jgi:hypothetical protein
MVATMDIPPTSIGLATRFGRVRGGDASSWGPGDDLFLSETPGELTNVRPEFPAYDISVGGVLSPSPAPDGEIIISITKDVFDTTNNFWNGVFRESFDFLVTSDGATVTGTMTPANGNVDMTMMFSDGFSTLDTSPSATVTLTAGTDSSPQTNYVYVPQSTKVLTVSTSDWPVGEHIKVATIVLQSAGTTQTDGALRNQNWNDHIVGTDKQGHLSHMTERMRQEHSAWSSGTELTTTIVGASSPDDVYVAVTAGEVYQMHRQIFPAFDMQTGDDIHVVNDSVTPYSIVTNLNTLLTDAQGNSMSGRRFSLVIWGVANKTGEASHLMVNLPTNTYGTDLGAINDASNYSVYTIPEQFKGVGFLIARVTLQHQVTGGGTWTLIQTDDLRGVTPNILAGGGVGGGGVSTFLGLSDVPSSYVGEALNVLQVNAGETALEFVAPYAHPNHTGQITSTGDGATVLTVSAITAQTALTTGLAAADEFLINDGGVIKRMDVAVLQTYMQANLTFGGSTSTHVVRIQHSDDGTPINIKTLDLGDVAWSDLTIMMYVVTAFDASAPQLRLGNSAHTDVYYYSPANPGWNTTGWKTWAINNDPDFISGSETLTCQYDDASADGTVGDAYLYFSYIE